MSWIQLSYSLIDRIDIQESKLMNCVRFSLQNGEHGTITPSAEVQELSNKALTYVAETLLLLPVGRLRCACGIIDDPVIGKVPVIMGSQRQIFTYGQLLTYLESLHEAEPDYWRNLNYIIKTINCRSRSLAA
ncbi:GH21888 [Drosophila grimshawi]|uniref:GH21888 n=1 Tax=Drosophila grimshawi TaxID=7222 RepID=B4J812_DROGR|nr:GH21888 [Drosophila grimshawi]